MSHFILDNSVAMRWHLSTAKKVDQDYAESVLLNFSRNDALVPELWHLEAVNVLISAEKRNQTSVGEVENFISQLECLPIYVDPLTANKVFNRTLYTCKRV